jgi:hypothetical protein
MCKIPLRGNKVVRVGVIHLVDDGIQLRFDDLLDIINKLIILVYELDCVHDFVFLDCKDIMINSNYQTIFKEIV